HFANNFKTEEKINKISNEEVRKALTAILIDSESKIETKKEYSSNDSENFIQQLDIPSSSESSKIEEDSCLRLGICNCDRNSPLKDEFLFQLNDLIRKEEKSKEEITPVKIKEIYN
ncbi:hypothetical protein S83_032616, partial [Arachis hypogaea]